MLTGTLVTEDTCLLQRRLGDFYNLFYSDYFLSQLNTEEIISVKGYSHLFRKYENIEVKSGSTLVGQFFYIKEDFLRKWFKDFLANISRYLQTKE
jgi:hypothetical protein